MSQDRAVELMAVAEQLAREAGDLVREATSGAVAVAATKSSGVDLVTEVDQAAEALIRRRQIGRASCRERV